MHRTWIFLVGLGLTSAAHADDALRARVLGLLSGYEDVPRAEEIAALGTDASVELYALAATPGVATHVRERATVLLGAFPTDAHHAFLITTLADNAAPAGLRRSAAFGLVTGWPDAALTDLEPGLTATDIQVRAQAARALANAPRTPAITARLVAMEASDANAMVRSTVQGLLKANAQ